MIDITADEKQFTVQTKIKRLLNLDRFWNWNSFLKMKLHTSFHFNACLFDKLIKLTYFKYFI